MTRNEKTLSSIDGRVIGLDLLRCISMIFISILHFIGHGGNFLNSQSLSGLTSNAIFLIEQICIVAVNCYVLISGYFLIKSHFKPKKVLQLWLEVEFYSVLVYLLLVVTGAIDFSLGGLIRSCLPFITKGYWFINAYLLMYILSPYLNKLLTALSKSEYQKLIAIELIFFCLWNFLPSSLRFDDDGGYGIIWFIVLYTVAGYLRLHFKPKKDFKPVAYLALYFTATLISFVGGLFAEYILGSHKLRLGFLSYNNIFVFSASLFLFLFFKNLDIKNKIAVRIIEFVAPLTLAVYLIHDNAFFRPVLWHDILKINTLATASAILPILLFSIPLIFASCIFIDFFRKKLFDRIFAPHVSASAKK